MCAHGEPVLSRIVMCIEPYITCMQAQELDIKGNTAEAEEKAALAKKLNIAAYITTLIYTIVVAIIIVGLVVAIRLA